MSDMSHAKSKLTPYPKRGKNGAPRFDSVEKSLSWYMKRQRIGVLGASQQEVCKRVGVSRPAYHTYESGDRAPNLRTFVRICQALYINPQSVIGDTEWEL